MTSTALDNHSPAALAIRPGQQMWNEKQQAALAVLGIKGASNADLAVFMHVCQNTGLDPFTRQIHGIMRREKVTDYEGGQKNERWVDKFTIQVGIDGFRVIRDRIAERKGLRVEYEDTIWYDADGNGRDVWLWDEPPAACRVVVLVDGRRFPSVLKFSEYCQYSRDGNKPVAQWASKPAHMIEKCAEANGLRRAFPNDMAGIRLEDEMPPAEVNGTAPPRGRVTVAEVIERRPAEPQDEPRPAARTTRRKTAAAGDDTRSRSRSAEAPASAQDGETGDSTAQEPAPRAAGAAPSRGAQPLPPLPGEDDDQAGQGTDKSGTAQSATGALSGSESAKAHGAPPAASLEPGEAAEYGTERHAKLIGVVRKNLVRFGYPIAKDETDEQRAARLDVTAKLAGVAEIGSSGDLDVGELSAVADTLARCKNREALDALLQAGEAP
jgi:phage recombination protein Bet